MDHVCVSSACKVVSKSATTWPSFVMPHLGKDHFPAAIQTMPATCAHADHFRRRQATYNRSAVKDPVNAARFRTLVEAMPSPHHAVEMSSHAKIVDSDVLEAAVEAFGEPPQRKPKQSYATAEDMGVVDQRRGAMASAHFDGKIIKQTPLKVTFTTWAQRRRPWRFHGMFGYVRPWVLKLRCVQMKLSRVLHGEITKRQSRLTSLETSTVRPWMNFKATPASTPSVGSSKRSKASSPRRSTKPVTLRR